MTVTVRPLAAADKAHWRALWDGYMTFYEHPVRDDGAEALWQRLMAGDEVFCKVAVDDGGEVIGIVQYLFHPSTSTVADKCYLQDLFVDPAHRVGELTPFVKYRKLL